ncbi:hypothetical protein F2Q70_00022955 [Brassica cretica]|uniref:DUF223 domain-containing protein n=1 Tax=Brassica cretica TaxID=69181 RepID=A0A8S9GFT6_BRACR|nr:hypothetical protein F2Q70_00022955 [Brassica cretica]KAF2554528.1 hypothetical protein F2Q68_00017214 [Brassica cretica]
MRITVLLLDEKVNSLIHGFIPTGRANHYKPSLKAGSIVKDDRFEVVRLFDNFQVIANTNLEYSDVVGKIQFVQGSDLSKEKTRVVIRLLIDLGVLDQKRRIGVFFEDVSKYFSSLLPPSDLGFISLTKFGILWYFGDISKQEKKGFKCKVYLVLDWKESLEMMFGGGGRSSLGGGGFTKRFTFSRRCHVALDFSNPCMCV